MSVLRAKREERRRSHNAAPSKPDINVVLNEALQVVDGNELDKWNQLKEASLSTSDDGKGTRGDMRRDVMQYEGTAWTAIEQNNLDMLYKFLLIEGVEELINRRSPRPLDGRRTLLHTASWCGQQHTVAFLITLGSSVDVVDTSASRTTPLIEAARAGHGTVCALLLRCGASVIHTDSHGDTAFHWAARRQHGTTLLCMALELLDSRQALLASMWKRKNFQGKTAMEYVLASTNILELLRRRLGLHFADNVSQTDILQSHSTSP